MKKTILLAMVVAAIFFRSRLSTAVARQDGRCSQCRDGVTPGHDWPRSDAAPIRETIAAIAVRVEATGTRMIIISIVAFV